jgi:AmmeMemoRadiSam system protein A
MGPSPSTDPTPGPQGEWRLTAEERELLLDIAESEIKAALGVGARRDLDLDRLPPALAAPGGAFVTLHVGGRLNGCIGTIESDDPIALSVARLAVQSAFEDPRLPALRREDLPQLDIEISLLSTPHPIPASTRAELLADLRPGIDGLIIAAGRFRAVFLPVVWRQLPDPDEFLDHLLRKAGLPTFGWPDRMQAEVFTATCLARDLGRQASTGRH